MHGVSAKLVAVAALATTCAGSPRRARTERECRPLAADTNTQGYALASGGSSSWLVEKEQPSGKSARVAIRFKCWNDDCTFTETRDVTLPFVWHCLGWIHGEDFGSQCFRSAAAREAGRKKWEAGSRPTTPCGHEPAHAAAWVDDLRSVGTPARHEGLRALVRDVLKVAGRAAFDEVRSVLSREAAHAEATMITAAESFRLEGLEQGRAEGKLEAVTRVVEAKFGRIPEDVRALLVRASEQELDLLLVRATGASSLDEALAR